MKNNTRRKVIHPAYFILSHKDILIRVMSTDLKRSYAGSMLGLTWAFIIPLIVMVIYAVVYLVIFKVRVPGISSYGYVLLIISGIIPFLMTSEALSQGVSSIIVNKSVLNNTVFPVELIAPKVVLLSQTTMIVGFFILLIGAVFNGSLGIQIILLPFLWILHVLALIGLTWILSMVNIVLRDLQNLISPILMITMILSPIAYTPEMVPEKLKLLVYANPFAYYILAYQKIFVLGQFCSIPHCLALIVISVGVFIIGGMLFRRSKEYLIDYV